MCPKKVPEEPMKQPTTEICVSNSVENEDDYEKQWSDHTEKIFGIGEFELLRQL